MTGQTGEKTCLRLAVAAMALTLLIVSGVNAEAADDYREVAEGRAAKIVDSLKLDDSSLATRVTDVIADFYVDLHSAHEDRDSLLAKNPNESQSIRNASDKKVLEAHRKFVALLNANLTFQQVDQVKDGITYGVVPITYAGYQRLLPNLTDDQKRMILANLLEAREYAMDAGSSHGKHSWFGKYKGRINNKLSAAGIDLKQAERDLEARKSQSSASGATSR